VPEEMTRPAVCRLERLVFGGTPVLDERKPTQFRGFAGTSLCTDAVPNSGLCNHVNRRWICAKTIRLGEGLFHKKKPDVQNGCPLMVQEGLSSTYVRKEAARVLARDELPAVTEAREADNSFSPVPSAQIARWHVPQVSTCSQWWIMPRVKKPSTPENTPH
jgi:hypothetical protein